MKIVYHKYKGIGTMTLSGRLDGPDTKRVKEALPVFLKRSKHLLIDCSELLYIDSSGLGALLSGLKIAIAQQGDIRLVNIGPKIKMTLELTGAIRLFQIYPTVKSARSGWTINKFN